MNFTVINKSISFILILLIVLFLKSTADATIIRCGTFGKTYPITEPDALKEFQDRAAQVDWSKALNEKTYEKAIENYHPDTVHLPRAEKEASRLVDMTYTLPYDIPDGKGGILYPRGYTFNPLDYIRFPQTIVVINGNDPDQIEWFEKSEYADDYNVMLLLSEGAYYHLEHKIGQPVYYASTDIIRRFQLQAVPAIVRQKGKYMEVKDIVVPEKTK